jgi:hypothetical protein
MERGMAYSVLSAAQALDRMTSVCDSLQAARSKLIERCAIGHTVAAARRLTGDFHDPPDWLLRDPQIMIATGSHSQMQPRSESNVELSQRFWCDYLSAHYSDNPDFDWNTGNLTWREHIRTEGGGRAEYSWRVEGICFMADGIPSPSPASATAAASSRAEQALAGWLRTASPAATKEQAWGHVHSHEPRASKRAFDRSWAKLTDGTSRTRAGRKVSARNRSGGCAD